ncbi:class II histone deacetylase [Metapseudomonas furukawaii]|uniref:class II histone deacetylase n=1 Tax=Metapseudomonas furukawaii TaxID=1149133 RepID=UPI00404621D9
MNTKTTGWIWDERFITHDTRAWSLPWQELIDHPEKGDTKRRFASLVKRSGLEQHLVPLPFSPASEADLLRVHTPEYVDRILNPTGPAWSDAGDGETPVGPGSADVARLAAGAVISTFGAVVSGTVTNAYALVRPPGHHAIAGQGMGYCIFHNTAIGIRHLQQTGAVSRVAVIDWDVHHGNGTETLFYDDPSVLTISLHQDDLYPIGRGKVQDVGTGPGVGANLNIPLPAGSRRGAYVAAFERVVVPAIRRFRPDLIVIASGFDSAAMDPFGRQLLHSEAYRELTTLVMDLADEVCKSRVAAVHEGGYDPLMGPFCGLAVVETLAGRRTAVEDPWIGTVLNLPEQALLPHHDAAIRACEQLVAGVPDGSGKAR